MSLLFEPKGYRIFQFHKGTIKTLHSAERACMPYQFQFHKGTIKTLSSKYCLFGKQISIP